MSNVHFKIIREGEEEEGWPQLQNGCSWVVGKWELLTQFSLLLHVWNFFYNKKILNTTDPTE